MKHLVIDADDFGLSDEVNAAVETAHREGILSAASLMVGGPAAADAIARARRLPNLRVGLHLVLVDGEPLLSRAQIPDLLDSNGRLRNDLAGFGTQIAMRSSIRQQMAKEVVAQFDAFRAAGLPLDHVNGHKHFHLHPAIAASTITVGRRYGMRALRVPVEPRQILARVDPQTRRGLGFITAPWANWLRRCARLEGLRVADSVFGLAWSGAMTAVRLRGLIRNLPAVGLIEIYLHPARTNSFAGAAPGYRYADEFAALCDSECRAALEQSGYRAGGYADAPAP